MGKGVPSKENAKPNTGKMNFFRNSALLKSTGQSTGSLGVVADSQQRSTKNSLAKPREVCRTDQQGINVVTSVGILSASN